MVDIVIRIAILYTNILWQNVEQLRKVNSRNYNSVYGIVEPRTMTTIIRGERRPLGCQVKLVIFMRFLFNTNTNSLRSDHLTLH